MIKLTPLTKQNNIYLPSKIIPQKEVTFEQFIQTYADNAIGVNLFEAKITAYRSKRLPLLYVLD